MDSASDFAIHKVILKAISNPGFWAVAVCCVIVLIFCCCCYPHKEDTSRPRTFYPHFEFQVADFFHSIGKTSDSNDRIHPRNNTEANHLLWSSTETV